MRPDDLAEAATLLDRVLALVEAGELEAKTANARAVLRRLEGAATATRLIAGLQRRSAGGRRGQPGR
jgi:hypothetical protein